MRNPRLKSVVALGGEDGSNIGLLFNGKIYNIQFERGTVRDFARFASQLCGLKTAHQIAASIGIRLQDVEEAIEKLQRAGLVYEYAETERSRSLDVQQVIEAAEALFVSLRYDLSRHPLFLQVNQNEKLFVAAAYEYYFLINDASNHIALALDSAPGCMKPILQRYLLDEKDHGKEIALSLEKAIGISAQLLDSCLPCAAGDAAIIKMRELARTDTLSYIAALQFCEAVANKPLRLNAAVSEWSQNSSELLNAMTWHHSQDVKAEHGSIFEESLLALNETIDETGAAKWLTSVHEFKHYLDNLNYEILRTYGVEGASLPRVRPSYRDYCE